MRIPWSLYDPIDDENLLLEINPNQGGSFSKKKSITRRATTSPQGRVILFEGLDQPPATQWQGMVLSQQHYEDLEAWFAKRHQFEVTDDLGRVYWAYFESLQWNRIKRHSHPWAHEYTLDVVVLDWPT